MSKAGIKSSPAVISGWLRFQRSVLHRPDQSGMSPPEVPAVQRPAPPLPLHPPISKPKAVSRRKRKETAAPSAPVDTPELGQRTEYIGTLKVGADVVEKVASYCREHGTTMEELFGEHDTRRTALMAHEVGIPPGVFLHLAKHFRGSLAPVGANT